MDDFDKWWTEVKQEFMRVSNWSPDDNNKECYKEMFFDEGESPEDTVSTEISYWDNDE